MSGPLAPTDCPPEAGPAGGHPTATFEVTESRTTHVGVLPVRRALPRRARRTVGAWCFVDHMGPTTVDDAGRGVGIGPHPHIGLQTVTWLLEGEVLHHDSMATERVIRPGQLNLMTAGAGVAHAEEGTGRYRGDLHGVQLWVAQPDRTRHAAPAFEHHADLPTVDVAGAVTATVLVGSMEGATSPARRDTELLGVDLALQATAGAAADLPLAGDFEHALVVLDGAVTAEGRTLGPGQLAYLGTGRDEIRVAARSSAARLLLLGGVPFDEPLVMWWNFVARTRDEVTEAWRAWDAGAHERFGPVASALDRTTVGPPPWARPGGA